MSDPEVVIVDQVYMRRLIKKIGTAGGTLRFDGWDAKIVAKDLSKIPKVLMDELKASRTQLIYYACQICPEKCPVCGGVGVHEFRDYKVCSKHNPDTDKTSGVWRLVSTAIARQKTLAALKEARARNDEHRIVELGRELENLTEEMDLVEKSLEEKVGTGPTHPATGPGTNS